MSQQTDILTRWAVKHATDGKVDLAALLEAIERGVEPAKAHVAAPAPEPKPKAYKPKAPPEADDETAKDSS